MVLNMVLNVELNLVLNSISLIFITCWFVNQTFKIAPMPKYLPLDETHLVVVRGLIHQEVSPKFQLSFRSYNRQVNSRPPQL